MKRSTHRSLARALSLVTVIVGVSACTESLDPTPLSSDEATSCRSACSAHVPDACVDRCDSACAGRCTGGMSRGDFSSVDNVDCEESGITFHEGSSELTCYP